MHKHRPAVWLFVAMASVLLALLIFLTMKNASRDKALIRRNALSQGYWIARSLEIGDHMIMDNHVNTLRGVVEEIE